MTSVKVFNKAKGDMGESIALKFLRKQGFKIIETNYKAKMGEIDIIAKKDKCLHFIEVKYRQELRFGAGRDAVHSRKQRTIRNVANLYLIQNKLQFKINACFDVLEIHSIGGVDTIEHLVNCF